MKRISSIKAYILLISAAVIAGSAAAPINALPQSTQDQAPFLDGKYVLHMTWRTGDVSDRENFDKNLLENFRIYLQQSGVSNEIIPEILDNIPNIAAQPISKNFDPGKDRIKSDINYNNLRYKTLDESISVLTLPWFDVKEIDLQSPAIQPLVNVCGNVKNIKAIEIVPAKDMSNLITIDAASGKLIDAISSGQSLVVQSQLVNPEIRTVAAFVNSNTVIGRSSGYRYLVLGEDNNAVDCVLNRVADATSSGSQGTIAGLEAQVPPYSGGPIAPVPELSTIALVSAGMLGILIIRSLNRKF